MDFFLLFLERHAEAIVVFWVFLAIIFVVIRPGMRFMLEYFHRRKIEAIRKEAVNQPPKELDTEMEGLLQKATIMGMTDPERIRRLAQSNPERAKDLIRNWIHGEGMVGRKAAEKSSAEEG